MFRKLAIALSVLMIPAGMWAQKKVTYYPNGHKAFKGRRILAWPTTEAKDILPTAPQVKYEDDDSHYGFFKIKSLSHLLPDVVYDGKCTFYRPDGTKWFSGKYRYGLKQGKFQYWYPNGQMAAVQYYQNGMADGHWQIWDSAGRQLASYHYRPVPDTMMKTIMGKTFVGNHSGSFLGPLQVLMGRGLKEIDQTYYPALKPFTKFMGNNLIRSAILDGEFKVWKDGKPFLQFAFKNNVPDGVWKYWDEDSLAIQLNIKDGKVLSGYNYARGRTLRRMKTFVKEQKDLSMKKAHEDYLKKHPQENVNAVDAHLTPIQKTVGAPPDQKHYTYPSPKTVGAPPDQKHDEATKTDSSRKKIFRFVDDYAKFSGGTLSLNQFIKAHIHYPKEAKSKNIQGEAVVEFVVMESGKIDPGSIKMLRSVAPLIDAEAIRLVKQMPDWIPAKRNGKYVKSYFVLPIVFKL